MNLPKGRKERIQLLVFVVIVATIVVYLGLRMGLQPMLKGREEARKELDELVRKLDRTKMEFRYLPQTQIEHSAALSNLNAIAAEYVLQPVLGSYLIGVTEPVESAARMCGLEIASVVEVGFHSMPTEKKRDGSSFAYRTYSVQVTGTGTFDELVAFLRLMEQRNPYLCVSSMDILARADNPERHRVMLRLDWPIRAEQVLTPAPEAEGGPAT
jgi:hypothetical protein